MLLIGKETAQRQADRRKRLGEVAIYARPKKRKTPLAKKEHLGILNNKADAKTSPRNLMFSD